MKICVLFDSKTGNTRQLAERIRARYRDLLTDTPADAEVVFWGSWTDKGLPSAAMQEVAATLHGKRVFVFGTCGFGGSQEYYDALFSRAAALLPEDNTVIGRFYCPGQMPPSVRARYVSLLQAHPDDRQMQVNVENFDAVVGHPDAADLAALDKALDALALQ